MSTCKKYKANNNHHNNPKGECQNCVYFSQANCGNHNAMESNDFIS